MTLDSPVFGVIKTLIPKARDEDPLQRSRPPSELCESVLIGILALLFATDGSRDLVMSVDDRLQHVDEIAPLIADRAPKLENVVAFAPGEKNRDVVALGVRPEPGEYSGLEGRRVSLPEGVVGAVLGVDGRGDNERGGVRRPVLIP